MKITVFGGSQAPEGSPTYDLAYRLGRLLGEAGHTVLTGGYIGTMEGVSRGASESKGKVIGVTCEEIEKWRPIGPNKYVAEQMRFPTLGERLMALVFNCDAAIALPGGIGTLAEIAVYWNHLAIEALPKRPLVLMGSNWKELIDTFIEKQGRFIPEKDQHLLFYADDEQAALRIVEQYGTRTE